MWLSSCRKIFGSVFPVQSFFPSADVVNLRRRLQSLQYLAKNQMKDLAHATLAYGYWPIAPIAYCVWCIASPCCRSSAIVRVLLCRSVVPLRCFGLRPPTWHRTNKVSASLRRPVDQSPAFIGSPIFVSAALLRTPLHTWPSGAVSACRYTHLSVLS
jgi:hypothetical protein